MNLIKEGKEAPVIMYHQGREYIVPADQTHEFWKNTSFGSNHRLKVHPTRTEAVNGKEYIKHAGLNK